MLPRQSNKFIPKLNAYLHQGQVSKPKAKVIAHLYPEVVTMIEQGFSIAQIVEAINDNEVGFAIELGTFKNTLHRLRKSLARQTQTKQNANNAFSVTSKKIQHDNNPNLDALLDRLGSGGDNLADYLKVCFNSERIAKRAMEAGVSIEEIQSWQCPNQIRLGTRLSHYSQNGS
jgi:DNA-binding transcriptional MerR regulator